MGPEASNVANALGVCKQQPEAKDGLGEDVKDGVGNDLRVDGPLAGTVSNTPDDGVQGPEDESEASDGGKELRGLAILGSDGTTARDGELIDDDEVGNAGHGVVSPLLTIGATESSEETEEDHQEIGHDGYQNVGAVQTCQEGQIQKEEWGGDGPVDVSGPEDLAEDVLVGVWGVLVCLLDHDVGVRVSVTSGHGEVGQGGEGGDQGGDDVEEAFLLGGCQCDEIARPRARNTYDWDLEGQVVEGQGGEQHEHEDDLGLLATCGIIGSRADIPRVSWCRSHRPSRRWAHRGRRLEWETRWEKRRKMGRAACPS